MEWLQKKAKKRKFPCGIGRENVGNNYVYCQF